MLLHMFIQKFGIGPFDMVTFDEVKAYRESLNTNVQWQPSGVAVLFPNIYAILRNGYEEKREVTWYDV